MLFDPIHKLKDLGFNPLNILDLGACKGEWSLFMLSIFPESKYVLIDATNYSELDELTKTYPNFQAMSLLLGHEECDVTWYERKNTGDSIFKENSAYYKDCQGVTRKMTTLDKVFENQQISFDLIKIDCQGSEIPILKGGVNTIKNTKAILLELPFFGEFNKGVPGFLEHIKFMDEIGFIPFDIMELHKEVEFLIQIDILFIKKDHCANEHVQHMISLKH